MNTLVQGYLAPTNDFQLNYRSKSVFSNQNHVSGYKLTPGFNGYDFLGEEENSKESPVDESSSSSSYEGESLKENDHSDAILKFISEMLMEEEDLSNKPCMLHDCLALQATERSLYDALTNNLDQNSDHFTKSCSVNNSGSSSVTISFVESNSSHDIGHLLSSKGDFSPSRSKSSGAKKTRSREDSDLTEEQRSPKQLANDVVESEPLEMYDNVLLCSNSNSDLQMQSKAKKSQSKGGSNRGRPRGGGGAKKEDVVKKFVDLRSLLMQCAQAVANFDNRTVNDLLLQIRQHSSPRGDSMERVAHYLANALEARLAGTGTALYAALNSKRISAAEILKAYKMCITACPFKKVSNLLANKTIAKLASGATTLHLIDFGILYGFQWPCLIHALSERPGGPPKLRITGIDFPQPGFRPAERVADTGRRLAKYCERFGVPFEYIAIAQKWDTINVEDIGIENNELVVVNSLYRLHNVPDETETGDSPRDDVLNLIKKINPDLFIHGVANGTYNTPFFVTRFREAFFHFSSMFDMFEATIPQDDEDRLLFEEHIYGKEAMNIIACEGTERVERPETYRQWQGRNRRAGFRQVPMDQEIIKHVRSKVKTEYHKDFSVDEDGKWLLQGWKGRVIHAMSCWQLVARN
ncbi:scarecrow-like protein 14 [Phtheirospermum japonicum]|uniref:Scarecrow-like protein 14 n=1 Tax=Phtheirospermum japonicum TaxID=374723 RepID=A0A830CNE2_9LAMI|nr:scarecrow-like protein 14 [Phtheirospermum japonicum]